MCWKPSTFKRTGALLLALLICFSWVSLHAHDRPRRLAVASGSMDFGNVTIGASSTQTITVTNTGKWSATISGATVVGDGFSFGGIPLPLTLPRGQSANFSVTFAPSAPGPATGSLSLLSNAAISPSVISLAGNGVQPALPVSPASGTGVSLSVSPTNLSFGSVLVGSSSSSQITLSNAGTSNLSISQAVVAGSGFGACQRL